MGVNGCVSGCSVGRSGLPPRLTDAGSLPVSGIELPRTAGEGEAAYRQPIRAKNLTVILAACSPVSPNRSSPPTASVSTMRRSTSTGRVARCTPLPPGWPARFDGNFGRAPNHEPDHFRKPMDDLSVKDPPLGIRGMPIAVTIDRQRRLRPGRQSLPAYEC